MNVLVYLSAGLFYVGFCQGRASESADIPLLKIVLGSLLWPIFLALSLGHSAGRWIRKSLEKKKS